ncbi:MAG TPA: dihydrolipoyl dehydrogenase [Candidatus Methylacidiphilales bacterium]|nr:dihydrolipoyl dehydrogenase [Candidatus Methylacidiphilales bacterium]
MSENHYKIAVIGGGPAGYLAAIRAGQLGMSTVLIEKTKPLGGTCLNVGCIPSKALLSSSEHYYVAKNRFARHGIIIQEDAISLDLGAMMKRKTEVVTQLTKGIDFLIKKNKVTRLEGYGKLLGNKGIEVAQADGSTTSVTADSIILATGSEVIELPFLPFNGKTVISSDHAIALDKVPASLLVIGGGAIGLELGSVWSRLGSKVTVIEFLPRIAALNDADVSRELDKHLKKQGIDIHVNTKVESADITETGVVLHTTQDGKSVDFHGDAVLVAVGRKPFTRSLGLEAAGVELTPRGRIKVGDHYKTTAEGIYAVGDVIDGPMLAHKAEEEGVAIVELLAGQAGHVNYDIVPNVIYTHPEAAGVGLTEDQLKEKGVAYKVGKFNFAANGRALANDMSEGFAKIIADAKTDKVLGVHILPSNASELLGEAVSVMEFGGSAEDIARTMHSHPTMTEVLKEAAWAVSGRALHGA